MEMKFIIGFILMLLVVLASIYYGYSYFQNKLPASLKFLDVPMQQQSEIKSNFDSLTTLLQECAANGKMNCWCNSGHQFPVGFPKGTTIGVKTGDTKSVLSLLYGKDEIKNSTINYQLALPQLGAQFEITFTPVKVDGKNIFAAFYKYDKIYLFNEGQIKDEWKDWKIADCAKANPYGMLCLSAINYDNVC